MAEPLRILSLEDSPADAELLQRQLRKNGLAFEARVVETRDAFDIQLASFDPNLVISDYALPAFDGFQALRIVRARSPLLPFILVTGHIGEERAAEALKLGATDFLLKDRLARLSPCVERALREVDEQKDRARLEAMFHQAQKMEAVGQLAGGMAHDFNNILAIIIGYLELLKLDVRGDRPALGRVKKAIEASRRASDLIDRLLTYSRRRSLQAVDFDINRAVSDTLELAQRALGAGVAVELLLDPKSWRTFADPALFASALTNLAINSADAMEGRGSITVQTANRSLSAADARRQPEAAAGDYVMVAVADTGVGIPLADRDRVLEPFFTTKEVGKGTGLGLSMVYGFIRQSGGYLEIESEVGAGATVRLYLPRANQTASRRS